MNYLNSATIFVAEQLTCANPTGRVFRGVAQITVGYSNGNKLIHVLI